MIHTFHMWHHVLSSPGERNAFCNIALVWWAMASRLSWQTSPRWSHGPQYKSLRIKAWNFLLVPTKARNWQTTEGFGPSVWVIQEAQVLFSPMTVDRAGQASDDNANAATPAAALWVLPGALAHCCSSQRWWAERSYKRKWKWTQRSNFMS